MGRVIVISAKCSDMCDFRVYEGDEFLYSGDGYVPRMAGLGGGDYVDLAIDVETGKLLDWNPDLAKKTLDALIGGPDAV